MAEVEFRDVTRRYAGGVVALKEFNLTVADGEFLILVGPSGCGKSTALRLLAGLDKPTSGQIRIGDQVVNALAPGERDIAMVFQNYALYPHMTVYRNLAYGLRQRKTARGEIDRRVRETAALLEIDKLLDRKPGQLSGGQRQRVAMGRALVRQPRAFLLDEPLSNLDAKLRNQVRGDLKRLHRELPVTSIYVTHDQVEAMTLGDRLCVMAGGEIQQIGTPDEIYNHPANTFVAAFMGSPPMNLFAAQVQSGVLHVGDKAVIEVTTPDGPVTVGARPEHLRLHDNHGEGLLHATVDFIEPLGSHVLVTAVVRTGDGDDARVIVHAPAGTDLPAGTVVGLEMPSERTYFFDADTGSARRSRERITL
ncbi:sn-glycerol-3-phosphate ABC transporter ATP-binding protein UgpC [Mycobacterium crocinum]|uniref:Sn-glycerol-3-phosphate ABC transporter ATP-binding protein UgpC n=1 Tax=Mycolicibacterium crocinum TaxID=388459 RepID=A0ABY3TCR7_9MYCO|nr:sn-glycerol-3-phosphate ABC transporter ATP-binding protein UgpC [Mycolicibacterium crocinum]MCV7218375.1 sn-glycerol-3-phosphate ABC transporter ATP-binding protein UgpC [Mycolicibacterium crocinum]ULN39146.1 sn-glycerol-3-phosphate ABC transporter ATP-binding protein UgpC [Mycolicibacterium crocinum]